MIGDGKNEIQFAHVVTIAVVQCGFAENEKWNNAEEVEEFVPRSLFSKLIYANRWINVGNLILPLLEESHATLINENSRNDSKVIEKKWTELQWARTFLRVGLDQTSKNDHERIFMNETNVG